MNEITVERSQETIATEINSIKEQTQKMLLHNSIEIGKRLVEAKAILPHGEWGSWLKESVDYSQSTANNLMNIYEEYGDGQAALFGGNAESEAVASLPYTKALALIGIPNYEREEFIEEHNVHDLSTRELDKVIKEKKDLEKKLEVYGKEAEEHKELKGQIDTQKKNIDILEKKLEEAESKDDEETIDTLTKDITKVSTELKESEEKVKKLEAELKKKPIDTVVKEVPKEVEQELESLRKQVANASSEEETTKFKFHFEALTAGFNDLLTSLNAIDNQETQDKFRGAVKKLIKKMEENL